MLIVFQGVSSVAAERRAEHDRLEEPELGGMVLSDIGIRFWGGANFVS